MVTLALAIVPAVVHACSVCFSELGSTRRAYYAITVFLVILPLTLALILWRAAKEAVKSHKI